ncbi:hypothetical protein ACWD3J_17645 [Streptomyces sp. NPDC002755]|uniref:hypothetical protein n=1 Tax=Streptomyces sp. NPDC002884 TaxID=3154544 RepID=UPI00332D3403
MSSTEKQPTAVAADITTMENHAPILPALDRPATPDTEAAAPVETPVATPVETPAATPAATPVATPAAEDKIVTLENHAPAPPALDLGGK